MEVASLCLLPVGVLPWNAPQPITTVIVKATFTMARDGVAVLADPQEPLGIDQPLADADDELYCASDFVPLKQAVDVLMVGHARAPAPTTMIPFALSVGHRRVSWVAVSDQPTVAIPLLQRHVRADVHDPTSARRLAPAPHGVTSWARHTIPGQFDFSAFNAAIPKHRVSELMPGTTLVLEGLLPSSPVRAVQISSLAPYIFYVPGPDPASLRAGQRVPLVCDTLWIDVDRALFTLTWRGAVERATGAARPLLVATMRPADDPPGWTEIAAQLDGADWYEAASETDLAADPPTGPLPTEHDRISHTALLEEILPVHPAANQEHTQILPSSSDEQDEQRAAASDMAEAQTASASASDASQLALPPEHFGNITATSWPRAAVLDAALAHEEDFRGTEARSPTPRPDPILPYPSADPDDDEQTDVTEDPTTRAASTEEADDDATVARPSRPREVAYLDALDDSDEDCQTAVQPELAAGRGHDDSSEPDLSSGITDVFELDESGESEPDLGTGVTDVLPVPGTRAAPDSPPAGQQTPSHATTGALLDDEEDTRDRHEVTAVGVELAKAGDPALPFVSGKALMVSPRSSPPDGSERPGTARSFGEQTSTGAFAPQKPALPFATPPAERSSGKLVPPEPTSSPLPPPAGVPGRRTTSSFVPTPPQPNLSAGPPREPLESPKPGPAEPAARAPTLPLETYATIKAALWDRPAQKAEILERHALDETTWRAVEVQQALAIARDASSGSGKLAVEIRQAIMAARRQANATEDHTKLGLEDYAALRVAMDEAEEPSAVLEERGLTQASWDRLQRTWSHRAKADARVAAELRRSMAAARRKAHDDDG